MPPRWFCMLILILWMFTTAKLLRDDLLPHLLPGTPPTFTIDLVEETDNQKMYTPWTLYKDDMKWMNVRTRVEKPERDLFELSAEYLPLERGTMAHINGMNIKRMFSAYRVNPEGELRGIRVEIQGQTEIPALKDLLKAPKIDLELSIEGQVVDGKMAPRVKGKGLGFEKEYQLPEVAVPRGGGLLQPLHPVNRIRGLRPGQTWSVPLFDSVSDSLSSFHSAPAVPKRLRAIVRPQPERFEHGRRASEECYVIDYRNDEIQAATWVSTSTGLVLLQEVVLDRTRWAMYRD
ncbi:MAG: hypothetical protein SNJ82_11615 [Gemmataceae bacterium]